MDTVDKTIIIELLRNCRISFSELANLCRIPADEIAERVKILVQSRFILKFTVLPSRSLFGVKNALLFFRSPNNPLKTERITLLGINSSVEYISVGADTEGYAFLHCRSDDELNEVKRYFRQIHPTFEDLSGLYVEPLLYNIQNPRYDLLAFEKVDWLILAHLREQGRLPLTELSIRTKIPLNQLKERLDFLRLNNLIEETIHLNFARTQKELFTLFKLELALITKPLYQELTQQLKTFQAFWESYCWKVVDQNILLLGFLCSSYTDVEKIQSWLTDTPGLISLEKVMGGRNYYFPDFRDELIEEKRSHGWFSPEQWVKN